MEQLECPKCGKINQEDEMIADAYNCKSCGCTYDMAFCENCEQYVGVTFGKDECPECGEKLD